MINKRLNEKELTCHGTKKTTAPSSPIGRSRQSHYRQVVVPSILCGASLLSGVQLGRPPSSPCVRSDSLSSCLNGHAAVSSFVDVACSALVFFCVRVSACLYVSLLSLLVFRFACLLYACFAPFLPRVVLSLCCSLTFLLPSLPPFFVASVPSRTCLIAVFPVWQAGRQ